jgi:hypothetical protein
MGGANESIRAGIAIVVAAALLLPATASALDPPEPLNVLFMANGYYLQETHIEDHFLNLGYAVTKRKDYQIKGTVGTGFDAFTSRIGDFSAGTPAETKTSGYGPYIIDAYSDDSYPGSGPRGDVVLWHTTSVGGGSRPYGVYSGVEIVPWP